MWRPLIAAQADLCSVKLQQGLGQQASGSAESHATHGPGFSLLLDLVSRLSGRPWGMGLLYPACREALATRKECRVHACLPLIVLTAVVLLGLDPTLQKASASSGHTWQ